MAGHSHWANIAHKKSLIDSMRGKLWSKLAKGIIVAARAGGGDPASNLRLRYAIIDAKAGNMPKDTIDRAIKKGTGELEGVVYEEVTYEGYGPEGVAVLIEVMTDNKNRTVAEIRHLFGKYNGNLGENGCVAWMFDLKGIITVNNEGVDEDTLMETALDAGATDIQGQDDAFEITTEPGELEQVRGALETASFPILEAEVRRIPQNTVKLDRKGAESMMKLMDALEDQDDVQRVSANFDIDDELMEELSG